MVRSCGTAFAVLGAALFTAACSSSSVAPSRAAQAQNRRDPVSPSRSAPASRPAASVPGGAPAVARAVPAVRPASSAPVSRCALAPTPAPAPVREATVAVRAINATCPVLVGTPVDPAITTRWKGATIAFSSTTARLMWETDPSRYSANVSGLSGSAGDAEAAFAKLAPAAGPAAASGTIVSVSPGPTTRVVSGAAAASPGVAAPRATPAVAPVAAAMHAAPVAVPATKSADGEECEECPGGVCRVPGR